MQSKLDYELQELNKADLTKLSSILKKKQLDDKTVWHEVYNIFHRDRGGPVGVIRDGEMLVTLDDTEGAVDVVFDYDYFDLIDPVTRVCGAYLRDDLLLLVKNALAELKTGSEKPLLPKSIAQEVLKLDQKDKNFAKVVKLLEPYRWFAKNLQDDSSFHQEILGFQNDDRTRPYTHFEGEEPSIVSPGEFAYGMEDYLGLN